MMRGLRGWDRPPVWALVAMAVVAVLLAVAWPITSGRGSLSPSQVAAGESEAEQRRAEWAAEAERTRPRTVAFLGDSYTGGGNSFGQGAHGWPRIVAHEFGWSLANGGLFAAGGTGYVNPGPGAQGVQPFGSRVDRIIAAKPDIVIAAGGINDAEYYPTQQIADAATDVLSRLRAGLPEAQIVVVGPFYPRAAPRQWVAARDVIFAAAAKIGAPTIDPLPWFTGPDAVEISDDGTHPTDVGHGQIAAQMIAELQRIGVPASQGT